jgi:hypothetical protein
MLKRSEWDPVTSTGPGTKVTTQTHGTHKRHRDDSDLHFCENKYGSRSTTITAAGLKTEVIPRASLRGEFAPGLDEVSERGRGALERAVGFCGHPGYV